jgi:DNA repair protein RadC
MEKDTRAKNVHAGHRDRMKDRYLESGAESFATHELLEMLLFYGIPQKDTNSLAHDMINHFGSLEGVISATPEELMAIPGIKKHAAVLISLVAEISRRCETEKLNRRVVLDSQHKVEQYIKPILSMLSIEKLYALYLDNSMRLIKCVCIAEGTVNANNPNIRRILESAIHYNAANVILAHNHPGGLTVPSKEDRATTHDIDVALRLIDINLVEHFIVADDRCAPTLHFSSTYQ